MSTTQPTIETIRHSTAHVLAAAVTKLFPDVKLGVGPVLDFGFYYDFQLPRSLTESDLPKLEKEMRRIIKTGTAFERKEMSSDEAIDFFQQRKQDFKVELLRDLQQRGTTLLQGDDFADMDPKKITTVSVYMTGDFVDLCRGPHVGSTKELGIFQLTNLAGAYWRGNEKNPQLQRVYGVAFATREELDAHLAMLEEAKKRDHRKLGAELDLFTFDDQVGPGLPLWLPNGTIVCDELEKLAKETEEKGGYMRVRSPHIAKESLYITSGHLPYYEETMYPPMTYEGGKYYLKAMNSPHHHKIYAARHKSYRDLPVRLAEYGTVYRHEKSGELFGIMRVRMMQMNDAHIYCTEDQFAEEFRRVNDIYLTYFKIFGIKKYQMRFSTHAPEKLGKKYINAPELWKKTENMVRNVLQQSEIPYVEIADEAAFYGPKIDVQVWSVIGREFTLATNQVDFAVPGRFGLTYTDRDGTARTPLCIHRAPLGTHERFIGFLIEHYAGIFPTWLAPVQIVVLSVGEKHRDFADGLGKELCDAGMRVKVDNGDESVGYKIRGAEKMKIPYMLVVGDKEMKSAKLAVRKRGEKAMSEIAKDTFITMVQQEVHDRV